MSQASGLRLRYRALAPGSGAPRADDLNVTAERLCQRLAALGVADVAIATRGDVITVVAPRDTPAATVDELGSSAQLHFYDWERNLLDDECRAHPDTPSSSLDGIRATAGLHAAVEQASRCVPFTGANTTAASAERYYAFDQAEQLIRPPSARKPAGAEAIKVPAGILVVREVAPGSGRAPDAWYVVHDDPALSGEDIENPEPGVDPDTDEPAVTVAFTDTGKDAFRKVTRELADRGVDNAQPGLAPANQSQHFAIVLDDALVSVPYVDYGENPDGIDGDNGAEMAGSFTVRSARDLAAFLEIGPLPVRLELLSRTVD